MSEESYILFFSFLKALIFGSYVGAFILNLLGFHGSLPSNFSEIFFGPLAVTFYGSIIATPVLIVYGLPAYLFMKKFNQANIFTAVIFGAIPGIASYLSGNGLFLEPILFLGISIAALFIIIQNNAEATFNKASHAGQ